MGLFSRRRDDAVNSDPLAAFWSWWLESGSRQTAKAIERKDPVSIADELSARIAAIDPGLSWELGPGLHAEHVLVVTAAGDPGLRATARRWLRSGPATDTVWEYTDLRRPTPDVVLTLDGCPPIPLSEAVVAIEPDSNAAAVHVGVHHSAFHDIDQRQRQMATFLLLDSALGEEMVETWLGGIEVLIERPDEARPLSSLLGEIAAFAREFTDDDGNPAWALLHGTTQDGQRLVASVELPLRSMRLPHLDTHVGVSVPFEPVRDDGLPDGSALDALRSLEDHLTARVDDSGRLVAHETSRGVRLFHFYVDGTGPSAEQLRVAAGGWPHGRVELAVAADAAWDGVGHLRG